MRIKNYSKIIKQNPLLFSLFIIVPISLALLLHVFIFSPLLKGYFNAKNEYELIQDQIKNAKNKMEQFEQYSKWQTHLDEDNLSLIIDEITRLGKKYNVQFVSISPKSVIESEDGLVRFQPIEVELVSEYKELALFMGLLDELSICLVLVDDFKIKVQTDESKRLLAKLTLKIFLENENRD